LLGAFDLLNDLLNVLLGVLASLIGWLVLAKALRPRIILGDKIDHVIRKDSSEYYRLTFKNPRIRRIEDVHVTARIFRRVAMRPDGRRIWESSDIPLDEAFRPVLGRLSLMKRVLRYLRGNRRLIQHVTLQLESIDNGRFLANLPSDCPSVTHLDKFLHKTDATIELAVRAADGFSGVYRTVAKVYKARDMFVIDRRAQQTVDASENDSQDVHLLSAKPSNNFRPHLSKAGLVKIFQAPERTWLRLTGSGRKRSEVPPATVNAEENGNGHEDDHAQGGTQG
jgi:hypothetical protein